MPRLVGIQTQSLPKFVVLKYYSSMWPAKTTKWHHQLEVAAAN